MLKKSLSVLLALLMIVSIVPMGAVQAFAAEEDDALPIAAGDSSDVTIEEPDDSVYFRFVPAETATYTVYSTGDADSYVFIYDSNMNQIGYDDDSGGNGNFLFRGEFVRGEVYFIRAKCYGSRTGSYTIFVQQNVVATEMTFTSGSTVSGYINNSIELFTEFHPEGALSESVEYTSSNPEVASVYFSTVSFHQPGTAIITAVSENGLTASCTVTVKDYDLLVADSEESFDLPYNELKMFKFTPDETRDYIFKISGDGDARFSILDSDDEFESVNYSYDSDDYQTIRASLVAGVPFYVKTRSNSSGTHGFNVSVSAVPFAESISISPESTLAYEGFEVHCDYSYYPEEAFCGNLTWSSSNENVATVDRDGTVTAVSGGTAEISVSNERGVGDSFTITVRSADIEPINAGDTKTVVIDEAGGRKFFEFTPDVSGECVLSAQSDAYLSLGIYDSQKRFMNSTSGSNIEDYNNFTAGETYYIACGFGNDDTGSYDFSLIQRTDAEEMRFSFGSEIECYIGTGLYLYMEFLPKYSLSDSVTYTSADEEIVSVTGGDRLNFLSPGTTTVTATSEKGLTAVCTVTVKDYESLSVGTPEIAAIENGGDDVIYKFVPEEDAAYVFWSSSSSDTYCHLLDENMDYLVEDDDGGENCNFRLQYLMTAGKTYYIRVRYYSSSETGSFTVNSGKIPFADSLSIKQGSEISACVTSSFRLDSVLSPNNCYNEALNWESSDENIAEVDGYGTVTCKSVGSAVITATSERGLSASCRVTVTDFEDIMLDEIKSAEIAYSGDKALFRFTPFEDGCYKFGLSDSFSYDMNIYPENEDDTVQSFNCSNCSMKAILEAGKSYIFSAGINSYDTGSFKVAVTKAEYAAAIEVISEPYRKTYVSGYEWDYIEYDGLKVKVSWSDGEETVWEYGDDVRIRDTQIEVSYSFGEVDVRCEGQNVSIPMEIVDNNVSAISVLQPSQNSLREKADGYWNNVWDSQTNSYTRKFYYDYQEILADTVIKVDYSDGSSQTATLGEGLNGYKFTCGDEQYKNPWTPGGENTIFIYYLGASTSMSAVIEESPVTEIEILGGAPLLIENDEGNWDTRYNPETGENEEFFRYDVYDMEDVGVRIHYKDGSYKDAHIGENVDGNDIVWYSEQYTKPWVLGSDNDATVRYINAETVLKITITENPISGIRVIKPTQKHLIENVYGEERGHYDNLTGEWVDYFCYDLSRIDDIQIQINYKDGRTKTAYTNSAFDGRYVEVGSYQDDHPFTLGENTIYVSYFGHRAETGITLIENPVKDIELIDGSGITLTENADGSWTSAYNPKTGKYDLEYFRYRTEGLSEVPIRVNYKDGSYSIVYPYEEYDGNSVGVNSDQSTNHWTVGGDNNVQVSYLGAEVNVPVTIVPSPVESISVIKNTETKLYENSNGYINDYDDDNEFFYYYLPDFDDAVVRINYTDGSSKTAHIGDNVDGYYIGFDSNQQETHWAVGSNNMVVVSYMGHKTEMPVTILENPVKSIAVTKAPSKVYTLGDQAYGVSDVLFPIDMTGIELTVNFKDGTKKVYTDSDFDFQESTVDGFRYESSYIRNPKIGSNTVNLTYRGFETSYNVTVAENPVEKIEILKLPDNPVYSRYYNVDWRGMKVRLTFKNGTAKTVTISENNLFRYNLRYFGISFLGFEVDGVTCRINGRYDDRDREFTLICGDISCEVTGLTYRDDKLVTAIDVEDFSYSGENMLIKATNQDGTTESVRLTDFIRSEGDASSYNAGLVEAYTDKGVLSVRIPGQDSGDMYGFDVYAFGRRFSFNHGDGEAFIFGDANGDGRVAIDDVTELQKFAAKLTVKNAKSLIKCGDVNRDGVINIIDVTAIQKYLAGYENIYGIGATFS